MIMTYDTVAFFARESEQKSYFSYSNHKGIPQISTQELSGINKSPVVSLSVLARVVVVS